jgi:hypothetical protein
MRLSNCFILSAAVGALALAAVPARAQHRGGGRPGGAPMGRAVSRAAAPRMVAPRPVFTSRAALGPRFGGPRVFSPGFAASRPFASGVSPFRVAGPRSGFGQTTFAARRVIAPRGFAGPRGFAPRFIGPRIVVSPFRFSRPFFAFRPRFRIGVGLWVGFPVGYPFYGYPYAYPYAYPYPYAYSYPYPYPAYGYPNPEYGYPAAGYPTQNYPAGSVEAQQQTQNSGGVSFEITPNTAGVYVDGTYVGTVAEFSPTAMPLTLALGRHHIELRVAGYQTMAFDTEIVAGQVIPYRGEMQPQR